MIIGYFLIGLILGIMGVVFLIKSENVDLHHVDSDDMGMMIIVMVAMLLLWPMGIFIFGIYGIIKLIIYVMKGFMRNG